MSDNCDSNVRLIRPDVPTDELSQFEAWTVSMIRDFTATHGVQPTAVAMVVLGRVEGEDGRMATCHSSGSLCPSGQWPTPMVFSMAGSLFTRRAWE